MRFSFAALLFVLPAIVSAVPSLSYSTRSEGLTVRHARLAQRFANPLAERAELSGRQTSCATQCSSTTDSSAVTAYNNCAATDAVCICNALEGMSSSCLACVLPAIGLSTSEFNQVCGSGSTTNQCDSQCSSASDQAANQAAGECSTSSLGDPCVCSALNEMSTTCRTCLLQASGITSSQFSQACAASGTTGIGSQPTGASGFTCATSCTSSSDQSALNAGAACAETDTTCQCNALAKLSSGCLTCELSVSGLSQQEYQAACAASPSSLSFTGAGGSSPTSTSAASSSSPTGSSSSGNGFTVASCSTSCSSSADQTAINQGNACSATNVACACNAFNAMDSTCRSCILTANGLTQTDLNSQCVSASSQGSASSTASPGSSSLPNGQNPTSGVLVGFSIGLKGVMGVAAVALGAVIFV
ncbi:hypothetical protein CALVIDRAFT_538436 [Calocera viscosa TUFC12733]|uniref:Extracellular membrane protein CFEM domain-containing protein n=1 Tax=Calocera viscosa (strain TUFC12733) TaxID=1330018 RepID=A0A167L3K9_CALVF|nr:hypothetical protein CALVIDRAFT_538436 [Calocera viscosa TUFC12733]